MRDFKGMKRQRGRNRNKQANNANNTNPNRSWDSQGPENTKVRGNAQTVYERYLQLARDAGSSGDRVLAENYQQHAEHYYRVLRALQPQRSWSDIAARELSNQGFDIDFEDESGAQAAAILAAQQAAERQAQDAAERAEQRDRERAERDANGDEPRAEGEGGGRRESRRERWERRRDERNRRFEAPQAEAGDESSDAADQPQADAPAETPAAEAPAGPESAAAERPRRGRPRRDAAERAAQEDDASAALPGFLTRPAPSVEGEEAAPARRRAPRRKAEAAADSEG